MRRVSCGNSHELRTSDSISSNPIIATTCSGHTGATEYTYWGPTPQSTSWPQYLMSHAQGTYPPAELCKGLSQRTRWGCGCVRVSLHYTFLWKCPSVHGAQGGFPLWPHVALCKLGQAPLPSQARGQEQCRRTPRQSRLNLREAFRMG